MEKMLRKENIFCPSTFINAKHVHDGSFEF